MKTCKNIQELILTDYSDGQLSAAAKRRVDTHVMQCLECRMLAERVRQETMFTVDPKIAPMPDPFVWKRIQNEIAKGTPEAVARSRVSMVDIMAQFLAPFRPAAAVAAVFLFLVIVPVVQHQLAQRPSYLAYVMDAENDGEDVGSGIERYFL